MSSAKRLCLSIEPVHPITNDGHDADLFAKPARLFDIDVQNNGKEIFTREDPSQSIGARLQRIWAERGDFSLLTTESILNPPVKEDEDEAEKQKKLDERPDAAEMRTLQASMLQSLEVARNEVMTALELLSVLSAPTDPPSVDPAALCLPQQTLAVLPSLPPPPLPTDDLVLNPLAPLPIATSLSSLKSSASAFLQAASFLMQDDEEAAPVASTSQASSSKGKAKENPWPTLLSLRTSTAYQLLPLGASKGASLTGRGETRTARQVGIFYGCPEAKEGFRRSSVARASDLVGKKVDAKPGGRTMVVEVKLEGKETDASVWGWDDGEGKGAQPVGPEEMLRAKAKAAFAEELFSTLSNEARTDASLKARLEFGKLAIGDSISMEGYGWSMKIRMVTLTPSNAVSTNSPNSSSLSISLLVLLRLLFLQEYAQRRAPPATLLWNRPLLQTLSVVISHTHRRGVLQDMVTNILDKLDKEGLNGEVEWWGGGERDSVIMKRDRSDLDRRDDAKRDLADSVLRVVEGEKELGGLAIIRVARSHFQITFSLLLPQAPSLNAQMPYSLSYQTLVLQAPGGKAPIPVPSLAHLESFLNEQMGEIIKRGKGASNKQF